DGERQNGASMPTEVGGARHGGRFFWQEGETRAGRPIGTSLCNRRAGKQDVTPGTRKSRAPATVNRKRDAIPRAETRLCRVGGGRFARGNEAVTRTSDAQKMAGGGRVAREVFPQTNN